MITMIVLVTVMAISRNAVSANHRNAHKHRNSYSNSINDIPIDFGEALSPFGNEHGRIVNGNNKGHGNSNSNSNGNGNGNLNTDVYGNTLPMDSTNFLDDSSYLAATPSGDIEDDLLSGGDGFGGELIPSGSLQKLGNSINSIEMPEETHNGAPYFDLTASKNVTALLGKTAYLNCRVKNLGNKTMLLQVSWVRHRDIHLLTVGRYTYTTDQRFRAIHQPQTEDWILQIKYTQHRDAGIYECQVSTTPHMSHYIHLNVVEPSTEIIGAPDMYIESGSTINLTCVILNSPEPPAYIFWNHNNAQIINYDSPRGGVSVVTLKGETTTSFLLIKSARSSDSGHYQCNPSNAKPKSVTVHVLNGASHSVSRGVPSSNAARGNIASSSAARTNVICLSVLLLFDIGLFHLLHTTARALDWWHYKLLQPVSSWLMLLNVLHTRRPKEMYRQVHSQTIIYQTQEQQQQQQQQQKQQHKTFLLDNKPAFQNKLKLR